MSIQELYQTFYQAFDSSVDDEQIQEWWKWITDLFQGDFTREVIKDMAGQLTEGRPIQYVVQRAPFFEMNLYVDEDVLIPRPETEELVFYLLKDNQRPQASLLDIGTGSGCIPLQIKRKREGWKVEACDISEDALVVAERNAEEQNVEVDLFKADLFDPSSFQGRGKYDIITSNPPYVDQEDRETMTEGTRFEPDLALFAPETSVAVYEALARLLDELLKPGGTFYFELNEFSAKKILSLFKEKGIECQILDDLQGKPRILTGGWSA